MQTLLQRICELEADQQRHVDESLNLRRDLDRSRQELSRLDTEKRDLARRISVKEDEKEEVVAQFRGQVKEVQEQLEAEAKEKDKKS